MYQHTLLKGLFDDSQDNHELHGILLSPTGINNIGGGFTSPKTSSLSIWDPLVPSSSMPLANLGSHEQIKPEIGLAPSSSTNNEATGSWIRESVSEANNRPPFVSQYAGLPYSYENDGVPILPFYDDNDLCAYSFSNAEPVGIGSQVLESGLPEESHNRGLLQRPHVSINESPSRTFENSFRVIDFFSKDNGGRQNVKLGDTNSSHKRKNVHVVYGESSSIISSTTFNDDTMARIVASEDPSLVSAVGNEVGSKRNTCRKITHADQATTSTPNLYLEENSFALCDPWPPIEISVLDVPSNPSVHSRFNGRNMTPNRQHLAHAIPGSTLDLYPPFHVLGSSTSEVGSSSRSPMPSIDEATEELNVVSGSSTTTHRLFTSHNRMGQVQDQSNRGLTRSSTILSGDAVPITQVGTNVSFHQLTEEDCAALLHLRRALNQEAVIEPFNFDLHHDYLSKLVENVHRESGPVNSVYPHSFTRTLNMLPRQNGGVSGVPLSTSSHATARREGRSRILEGPRVFESSFHWVENSYDYQDMRMDIDDMSYEELLSLEECIGNVNSGLSEAKILSGLWQFKYISSSLEPSEDAEQCSICREEYVEGEQLSRLDCDHDFHTVCIKKWLGIKNLCPICKATGIQGA